MSIAYIGPRARGGMAPSLYVPEAWHERDNFELYPTAVAYAQTLSRTYPHTPYRIDVGDDGRSVVKFVPAWHLRSADGRPTSDVQAIRLGDAS